MATHCRSRSLPLFSVFNGCRGLGTEVIDLKSGRLETVFDKRTIKGSHSINIRDVVCTHTAFVFTKDGWCEHQERVPGDPPVKIQEYNGTCVIVSSIDFTDRT